MAILLAYNITPESPPKQQQRTMPYPVTPVPSPPLSPSPPPILLPPPTTTSPASQAAFIPLPKGRRISHPTTATTTRTATDADEDDDDDVFDAETRFNTQFNTRRSAATNVPFTASTRQKAKKGRRVGFKRELATLIPPPCLDLVVYGQQPPSGGCGGGRKVQWWWEWLLVLVLMLVLVLVGCLQVEWRPPGWSLAGLEVDS